MAAAGGLVLACMGWLCRGRDTWMIPALCYYATPWLARSVAGAMALLFLRQKGVRCLAAACLLVSLSEGARSFRLDPLPAATSDDVTVSVWNAGRMLNHRPELWRGLADADISAIVESGSFRLSEWKAYVTTSPGHTWKKLDTGMLLGVRGTIVSSESFGLDGRCRCHRVHIDLPGRGSAIVVVCDVRSQPWLAREESMAAILKAAGDDPRVIILGDFNTPPESQAFASWRARGLGLANDGPRRGFRETWPYALPLWTLDQVWHGPGWATTAVRQAAPGSDHRRVSVTLRPRLPAASPSPATGLTPSSAP